MAVWIGGQQERKAVTAPNALYGSIATYVLCNILRICAYVTISECKCVCLVYFRAPFARRVCVSAFWVQAQKWACVRATCAACAEVCVVCVTTIQVHWLGFGLPPTQIHCSFEQWIDLTVDVFVLETSMLKMEAEGQLILRSITPQGMLQQYV